MEVRSPRFRFEDVPRWWNHDSPLPTHLGSGLHMVFPAGERFFIRSVRHFLPRIQDPGLRARVDLFVGQEAAHQRAHLQAFEVLEAQGYEIRSHLDRYERWAYGWFEPKTPWSLRLATTAALEHLTALFGELALDTPLLDAAHPEMARLLRWHAAEEIEHRDVAFDVFQAVDGRWWVRMAGLIVALTTLPLFWIMGARHLMKQERDRPPVAHRRAVRSRISGFWRSVAPHVRRRLFAYLRPGFHPNEAPLDGLARRFLADGFVQG